MKWQQLIAEVYRRMSREYENVLDGLTLGDLHKRPAPDANTIGWLLWHTARSYDRTLGDVMYGEQLWTKEGWYRKFNRSSDPDDTGYRHNFEEVGNLRIPDIRTLIDYQRAVIKASIEYVEKLTEEELDRECPLSTHPGTTASVGRRIIGNINDCYQHLGQAAYVRGLIQKQGWLGK
ncbi:MAG: DinB family protein [Dehalococcoidales bacterium]|nr:DinB family protein [Dehalococcoidales bacterium]